MTCKDTAELIEAIAADEIRPTPEMRAHLESCPSCASTLATARRLEMMLSAHRPPAAPDRFVASVLQRVRRERWRMGARTLLAASSDVSVNRPCRPL